MPIETVRAESFLEGLVWLVIFVFWVAAQIFGSKNKKKRTKPGGSKSRPQQSPQPRTTEDTLRDFLEGLNEAANEGSPKPPPLPREEPPTRPVVQDWDPPPERQAPAAPPKRRAPVKRRTPSAYAERESMIERRAAQFEKLVNRVSELAGATTDTHRDIEAGRRGPVSAMSMAKTRTMNMSSMSFPISRVTIPSLSDPVRGHNWADLMSADPFRQAIIARAVLGPPRAVSPENYEQNIGAM